MRTTIRLTDTEGDRLATMWENNNTVGFANACEFIRMLLAREWNRRQGTKTKPGDWQTDNRIGRPDWQTSQANRVRRQNRKPRHYPSAT